MTKIFLQLNKDKTEILVVGYRGQREEINSKLISLSLKHIEQFRNLGVILDSELNITSHITAFYLLKNIS